MTEGWWLFVGYLFVWFLTTGMVLDELSKIKRVARRASDRALEINTRVEKLEYAIYRIESALYKSHIPPSLTTYASGYGFIENNEEFPDGIEPLEDGIFLTSTFIPDDDAVDKKDG